MANEMRVGRRHQRCQPAGALVAAALIVAVGVTVLHGPGEQQRGTVILRFDEGSGAAHPPRAGPGARSTRRHTGAALDPSGGGDHTSHRAYGINTPPLSGVGGGEQAVVSFNVDSDNFVEGVPGDTRGYVIDESSFSLAFSGGVTAGLINPFPTGETPYFTLVDGFPVSDGFFISTSPMSPGGVPLEQDPVNFNLDLGYDGSTLGSLNILDAEGTYGFTGLTRFSFTLWRTFPDNVIMEMDFMELAITAEPLPVEPPSWGGVKATFN